MFHDTAVWLRPGELGPQTGMASPRTAIFPVAGLGTRFLPATKAMPKEMLPVVDKPLIQYAVEEAKAAGIEQFIFVTGRGKSAIEDHFDLGLELNETLRQRGKKAELESVDGHGPRRRRDHLRAPAAAAGPRPRGLVRPPPGRRRAGGRAAAGRSDPGRDALPEADGGGHRHTGGNVIAVMEVAQEHTSRYGVLKPGEGRRRADRGEGPGREAEAGCGALDAGGHRPLHPGAGAVRVLDAQEAGAGGEIQLTDAMARLIGGEPFHGYRFDGERFDCGDKAGFLEANLRSALRASAARRQARAILVKPRTAVARSAKK